MYLQGVVQLVADVRVLLVVVDLGVVSDQGVLRADVNGVIDLPVDVSHLPGRVEQTLKTKDYSVSFEIISVTIITLN